MVRARLTLRIMQFLFIAYAALLFWLMDIVKPQEPAGELTMFHKAIAVLAVVDCLIGIGMRRLFLKGAVGKPRNGLTVTPIKRWYTANIIGLAFAMSTCLFGFALHMLSAPDRLAQALIALGIVVMLFMNPGAPPAERSEASPYPNIE